MFWWFARLLARNNDDAHRTAVDNSCTEKKSYSSRVNEHLNGGALNIIYRIASGYATNTVENLYPLVGWRWTTGERTKSLLNISIMTMTCCFFGCFVSSAVTECHPFSPHFDDVNLIKTLSQPFSFINARPSICQRAAILCVVVVVVAGATPIPKPSSLNEMLYATCLMSLLLMMRRNTHLRAISLIRLNLSLKL